MDRLRSDPAVLRLARAFYRAGKHVGFIGHGVWVGVSAGILSGHYCTSDPRIKDDLTNAGGLWQDEPVVADVNLIFGRCTADLPAFAAVLVEAMQSHGSMAAT